ncbi:MAG: galactokinase, partial [Vicinamibacteria bacterium]
AYLGSVESGRPFRQFGGESGVGVSGGSQDHTAILASEAGRVCQFAYAPARYEGAAELPRDVTFVIGVSGVIAQKTGSARAAYNRAAGLSGAVLDAWRVATSRDDATLYEAAASSSDAPGRIRGALSIPRGDFEHADLLARFDQFFDETFLIIPKAFAALSRQDLKTFGDLVDRSQGGAEKGLSNQVAETIALARSARSLGAHAASAFGAGFGGSVWALVNSSDADAFSTEWERAYRQRFDYPQAAFFRTNAGPPLLRLSV